MVVDLPVQTHPAFSSLISLVSHVKQKNGSSAAALVVIKDDRIVAQWYAGQHRLDVMSRAVQADSQFNVYSVRKTYIGFAVAHALYRGLIGGLDDPVAKYLDEPSAALLEQTTIRHLLTHTHGLDGERGAVWRRFPIGAKWHYTNTGIRLLNRLVERVTGMTVAQLVEDLVLLPLGFCETRWRTEDDEHLIHDVQHFRRQSLLILGSDRGDDRNLYVSARELAYWGYLHLVRGMIAGEQLLPSELFAWATAAQSPKGLDRRLPRQGFCWWIQTTGVRASEMGDRIPEGSAQILGYSGCLCLVIPEHRTVAVRMYNSMGGRLTFVRDAKKFGDQVMECLSAYDGSI